MRARYQPAALNAAVRAIRVGESEQQLIERTLGRALLDKMQGQDVDVLSVYRTLGGTDPVVHEILGGELGDAFKTLPVLPGVNAARDAALSDGVAQAAAAKNSELVENALTGLQGQALRTLAELGGPDFARKYQLDR